jgi:hypothetical protein
MAGRQHTVAQASSWSPVQGAGDALAHAPGLDALLARWGQPAAPAAPLTERLGACLAWTDVVALSQALAPAPPVAHRTAHPAARPAALGTIRDQAHAALQRLHATLQAGFDDPLLRRESAQPLTAPPMPLADLLAPYRLHLAQQQRDMAQRVTALRQQLRASLARSGVPRLVQLAQLDLVFDRALAARQLQALAVLPTLQFEARVRAHRVRDAAHWRARLWADLQQLLAAERSYRLQPVLGLLEALQAEAEAEGAWRQPRATAGRAAVASTPAATPVPALPTP